MQYPIYLVGFMGAGKSHVGLQLADYLYCPYLDLDQYIEKKTGRKITDLFTQHGEAWFRMIERRALHDTVFRTPGVIATGGGAPCFFDNIHWMNRHGVVIFLDADPEVLLQRLWPGRKKRPLLKDLSRAELRNFIEQRTTDRRYFYEQAHVHYYIRQANQDSAAEISARLAAVTGH